VSTDRVRAARAAADTVTRRIEVLGISFSLEVITLAPGHGGEHSSG
jgi:hypothetical protein